MPWGSPIPSYPTSAIMHYQGMWKCVMYLMDIKFHSPEGAAAANLC